MIRRNHLDVIDEPETENGIHMTQLILYTSEDGQSRVQLAADAEDEVELKALEGRIKHRKGTTS